MTAIGYIFLAAVLSTANAQYNAQEVNVQQIPSRNLQGPEVPLPLPYTLQLPNLKNPIPFYDPEVSTDLRPPSNNYNIPVAFYELPAPSQELQVPNREPWNPNNDEIYYYTQQSPILENDGEVPTNSHPKKYNKDVHEKPKLVNLSQKGDDIPKTVGLEQQRKALERFNKLENKKEIEAKKTQPAV